MESIKGCDRYLQSEGTMRAANCSTQWIAERERERGQISRHQLGKSHQNKWKLKVELCCWTKAATVWQHSICMPHACAMEIEKERQAIVRRAAADNAYKTVIE